MKQLIRVAISDLLDEIQRSYGISRTKARKLLGQALTVTALKFALWDEIDTLLGDDPYYKMKGCCNYGSRQVEGPSRDPVHGLINKEDSHEKEIE